MHKINLTPALPLIAGLVVILFILFSTAGIARMLGWGPVLSDDSGGVPVLDRMASVMAGEGRAGPRCPECSTIVSIRKMEDPEDASAPTLAPYRTAGERDATMLTPATSYEIVVRMADGSSRALRQASPASWQPGESVIVIDGTGAPDR